MKISILLYTDISWKYKREHHHWQWRSFIKYVTILEVFFIVNSTRKCKTLQSLEWSLSNHSALFARSTENFKELLCTLDLLIVYFKVRNI